MTQPDLAFLLPLATLQAGTILAASVSGALAPKPQKLRASHLQATLQPVVANSSKVPSLVIKSPSAKNTMTSSGLNGKWKKNWHRSDTMDELYEVASLPWYLRKGEKFLRYLELEETDQHFRRTFNAGGFLNVSEVYPKSGAAQQLPRRDQRKGMMEGRLDTTEAGLCTRVSWGNPYGLEMVDDFRLSKDGMTLTVSTTAMRADGSRSITCQNVFNRVHEM